MTKDISPYRYFLTQSSQSTTELHRVIRGFQNIEGLVAGSDNFTIKVRDFANNQEFPILRW